MPTGPENIQRALPDYLLEDRLGAGQFGEVWSARHRQLGREVAIKQLTGVMSADPRHRERFRREARILAHLDHRHVVKVYDYRESEGLFLLIMERLTGGTLADRRQAGLDQTSVVVAILAAGSALHHLHQQGVLHRDVKPQNLMFHRDGTLKVTDFGTARGHGLLDPSPAGSTPYSTGLEVSSVGEFIGTPGFAAPEQAAAALGVPGAAIGPAADQYALAAVLYQALSGRYTHSADAGAISLLRQRISSDPDPLRAAGDAGSPIIAHVVMRSLARDPNRRFPSTEAFALALAAAYRQTYGPEWAAHSRVRIAEPGQIWDAVHGRSRSFDITVGPADTSVPSVPNVPPMPGRRRLLIGGSVVLVATGVGAAVRLWTSGNSGARPAAAISAPASSSPTSMKLSSSPVFPQPSLEVAWAFPTAGNIFATPLLLADVVVVGSMDGTVYALDKQTKAVRWKVRTDGPVRASAARLGGAVVVGGDDGMLRALWASTGKPFWTADVGYQMISTPAVGAGRVVVGADKLYAFDSATGARVWSFPTGKEIVSSPVLASGLVVVGCNDGYLYGVRPADGQQHWRLDTGGPVLASPTIVDGVVYIGSRSGLFRAVTVADGKQRWAVDLGARINSTATVTATGPVVGTESGVVAQISPAGKRGWSWTAPGPVDASPVIMGDLVMVASGDSRLYALDVLTGRQRAALPLGGTLLSSPRVDGSALFIGSYDHQLYRITVHR